MTQIVLTQASPMRRSAMHGELPRPKIVFSGVMKFLLWCILLVICWPLAILAFFAYPFIWVLLIPFRLLGIAVDGALGLFRAIVMLPARLVSGHGAH